MNHKFSKTTARYYEKWFHDCIDSAEYCRERDNETGAREYLNNASEYLTIIMENWEAIEFFKIGDKAFMIDEALPKEFRGY